MNDVYDICYVSDKHDDYDIYTMEHENDYKYTRM